MVGFQVIAWLVSLIALGAHAPQTTTIKAVNLNARKGLVGGSALHCYWQTWWSFSLA